MRFDGINDLEDEKWIDLLVNEGEKSLKEELEQAIWEEKWCLGGEKMSK